MIVDGFEYKKIKNNSETDICIQDFWGSEYQLFPGRSRTILVCKKHSELASTSKRIAAVK